MNRNTFGRAEHLKSEKLINELFEKGKNIAEYPVRLVYAIRPDYLQLPIKAGFAVPKKKFKRAADRNLLKRRMREAYRLNKLILSPENETTLKEVDFMLVYQAQGIETYAIINASIQKILMKLCEKLKR